tara:strand:- start:7230 stop:7736 length:507 start_codon:yes stop_codon:yes gene_type:complete
MRKHTEEIETIKTMQSSMGRQVRHTMNIPVEDFNCEEIIIAEDVIDLNIFYADGVKLTIPNTLFQFDVSHSKITELKLPTNLYRGSVRFDTKITNSEDMVEICKTQPKDSFKQTANLKFMTQVAIDRTIIMGCIYCSGAISPSKVHICAKTYEHKTIEIGQRLIKLID